MKAKILLVSQGSTYTGGAEFVFTEAVSALRTGGASVIAVYPAPGDLLDDALALGAAGYVRQVPRWADWNRHYGARAHARWAAQHVEAAADAYRFIRRQQPSVVVTNTLTPPSFALAARLARVPHIWMVHEFGTDLQFLLGYTRTIRWIGRLSETVICCSSAVQQRLLEVAPGMRTRVIYYGIESPQLPFRPRRDGPLRAALLGQFSEGKGQSLAVEAIALARAAGADVTLTLVGPGDSSQARELATNLGVSRYVECKPLTSTPIDVWREAEVGLMCSRVPEGFGRVTVEAMRASLPVCGSDSGGTREILSNGVNGLLFRPGDSSSLASQLIRLANDESLRQSLGEAAGRTGSTYSADRYRQQLQDEVLAVVGASTIGPA